MTDVQLHDVDTAAGVVAWRAKLPDDLTFIEYADLIEAIDAVNAEVVWRSGIRRDNESNEEFAFELPILKAQYGSDFLVVLGLIGVTAATTTALAGTFIAVGKALKVVQESRLVNEERLGMREDRLFQRQQRKAAEDGARDAEDLHFRALRRVIELNLAARRTRSLGPEIDDSLGDAEDAADEEVRKLASIFPHALRAELESLLGPDLNWTTLAALRALAEYKVEIVLEDDDLDDE